MSTEQIDPRALLAKIDAEEKSAREKADKLAVNWGQIQIFGAFRLC
jgi:hypothetical protein